MIPSVDSTSLLLPIAQTRTEMYKFIKRIYQLMQALSVWAIPCKLLGTGTDVMMGDPWGPQTLEV
jgi:hypothetical protein